MKSPKARVIIGYMELNEKMISDFADEIRDGLPAQYVCGLLRIHETTYHRWMRLGEDDVKGEVGSLYAEFYSAIKKAYAEFVKEAKARIRGGAQGWQGTAWWLERTNKDFMPKQQVQADDEGKVTVVIGGKQKGLTIKKDKDKSA